MPESWDTLTTPEDTTSTTSAPVNGDESLPEWLIQSVKQTTETWGESSDIWVWGDTLVTEWWSSLLDMLDNNSDPEVSIPDTPPEKKKITKAKKSKSVWTETKTTTHTDNIPDWLK